MNYLLQRSYVPLLTPATHPGGEASSIWLGVGLSASAVLFVLISAWWLYLSPLPSSVQATHTISPRLAHIVAALLGVSFLCVIVGALWDGSMHIQTGEVPAGADFLWPPHILIYCGFLLACVVAVLAIGNVALPAWRRGVRDPRRWVRQQPYIGAIALASGYELLAIPGDALWHEIIGPDLTAWSPPHLLLGTMSCIVIVCATALLTQTRERASRDHDMAIIVLLALMLNVAFILGVIEWEFPEQSPVVLARPIWLYPLISGSMVVFVLGLVRRLVHFRWAATATAITFYAIRLTVTGGLVITDNVVPAIPLMFILGALLMDAFPFEDVTSHILRYVMKATSFTVGYSLLAIPVLIGRTDTVQGTDIILTTAGTFAAALVLLPFAQRTGRWLAAEDYATTRRPSIRCDSSNRAIR